MDCRLPDFLVLGTQKGGTTTLHQLLDAHPEVFLPSCKEVHYFDLNHQQQPNWYGAHYARATPAQHCGDITPFYLFHPEVPQRIHALIPQALLIVLLRDPVERALSQVFHARRKGFETLPPEEALAAESQRLTSGDPYHLQKHSYVSRSRYLEQLDRYEALFPAAQLLVLRSENLFANPEATWQRLQGFLGLAQLPLPMALPRANAGAGEATLVPQALREQLRAELAATAAGVRARYGFGWDWD
jgi:hypothetical protein